jgi:flagellar protein FliS
MIYGAKAYAQVGLESGINSSSPHGLILMLYDGALDAIKKSKIHLEMNNIEMKTKSVDKALRIIKDGLITSLDINAGGEIALQLLSLYEFISNELILANVQNNPERMNTCIDLLEDLRTGWHEIGQTANR